MSALIPVRMFVCLLAGAACATVNAPAQTIWYAGDDGWPLYMGSTQAQSSPADAVTLSNRCARQGRVGAVRVSSPAYRVLVISGPSASRSVFYTLDANLLSDGRPSPWSTAGRPAGGVFGCEAPARTSPAEYFYAGGEIVSSPKPVNIDGDPRPGIVLGTSNGEIYLVTADGVPAPGWPVISGSMVGYSTPAVADVNGDQSEDIVIHANNSLEVYSQDGSPLPGWPRTLDSNISGNSRIGSPTVADIDNDGDPEILVGHMWRMYAFHHDGTSVAGWPIAQQHPFGPLYATPAVADLDGDGDAEICFKVYGGNGDPADIYLLHHDGTDVVGWPKLGLDRSHLSSPIFADIDADGALDIVVSLHYYDSGNYVRVYVWRLDGSNVAGFPVGGSWNTVPAGNAVGDVDGDGFPEIFVGTNHYTSPYYAVHAWNHDATPLSGSWPRSAPFCNLDGSPALADVNGGGNEVIIGVGGCYVADEGAMNVWADDGSPLASWPRFVPGYLRSSPLVMDSDDDGVPEIYVGSSNGWVYRFLTEDASGGSAPEWNQIFHNPRNTNHYPSVAAMLGDLNCDGVLNAFDIDPFVLALTDPTGYAAAWPDCDIMLADCNGDGVVNAFDIDPFVELLTGD